MQITYFSTQTCAAEIYANGIPKNITKVRDFFLCTQEPKFHRIPNGIYVTFIPIWKKYPNLQKKLFFFFFFEDLDFYSVNTHTQAT